MTKRQQQEVKTWNAYAAAVDDFALFRRDSEVYHQRATEAKQTWEKAFRANGNKPGN